jgi:type II secretory pathway pseudopilin PulG
MVAVSAGAYAFVWQGYKFQAVEEKLQQQIVSLEIQLQQEQKNSTALQKQLNDESGKNQDGSNTRLSGEDKKHVSEALGIDFDYYLDFSFGEALYKDGSFGLCSSENDFCMVGVNHKNYSPDTYSFCAAEFNGIKEFCEGGCEKINENVAIDYRSYDNNYNKGFNALLYSDLSSEYPSICFTLNLNDALDEASRKKGISYYDISDSDIKSMIKNRELSDDILQKVDAFEKMAKTIKKIE